MRKGSPITTDYSTLIDDVVVATYIDLATTDELLIRLPEVPSGVVGHNAVLNSDTQNYLKLSSSDTNATFQPIEFRQPYKEITLFLGAGADSMEFGTGVSTASLLMEVVGGDGVDTLVVPRDPEDGETNRVFISDIDKGSVTKTIGFSEVENLTGATGITDLFTFQPDAVLSGELYGQSADQDSLVFQLSMGPDTQDLMWNTAGGTGTVSRNDSVITSFDDVTDTQNIVVFGTELSDKLKVSTNQSKIEVEGGNSEVTFGAVTFYSPQGSLLIGPEQGMTQSQSTILRCLAPSQSMTSQAMQIV